MERSNIGQPWLSQNISHTCLTGMLQGVFCEHLEEAESVLMEYILVQIMACPLFGTKSLSESMLSTGPLPTNSEGQINIPTFFLRKHICIFAYVICKMMPILFRATYVDSSHASAAYMRQSTGSALLQIMACCLFGAKPLSKPMLGYCQLDHK